MTYNIHPLLVHFPIALLFIYSLVKILPLKKYLPNTSFKQTELVLLVFGILGAFGAIFTGEIAEHIANPNHQIVETHAFFANFATWIYGLILAGEILSYLNVSWIPKFQIQSITRITLFIEKILTHRVFSKILALIGLVAISVTGMLGGVMVYGTSADPLAPMILNLFGITL